MPNLSPTGELSALLVSGLLALTFLALGFLLATLRQSRRTTLLKAQLEQSQLNLEQNQHALSEVRQQHKQSEADLHQLALSESKLREQLTSAQASEARLQQELNDTRQKLASETSKLDETREQQHRAEKLHEAAQSDNRALREQIQELRERLARQEASNQQLQQRCQQLDKDYTELNTQLHNKEEHFKEQMQQLLASRQSLTQEFESLANKIFEEKGKTFAQTFTHTSQTSIDSLLKPFREQIEGFQKRINEVHDASLQGTTTLHAEIRKVLEIGLHMSKEANNLSSALKGDSQQRGAWGEAQLRRTLEMSGLIEEAHFEVQSAFKDNDGKQKQTDYLIKLPDGKHMIIDSKVALNAYDRAVSAATPEEYQVAMSEHLKAVRKHIDDLASKDYTNLIGMRSPGFVLMFMPIEPAYIEALKNNKDLFDYGYKKGIVLVSHTTLIPILRTVSNLWMIERSNAEAREISEKAGGIYNQVCLVAERLSKLGGTLSTVSNHYNDTVKALAGQQGLYGKVERFSQLSAKVSKSLPSLEPAHMDFERERLGLIVEAVEEDESEVQVDEIAPVTGDD